MSEIMDCPFCGGVPILEEVHRGEGIKTSEAIIHCECGISTIISEDWVAIKLWNRRDGP